MNVQNNTFNDKDEKDVKKKDNILKSMKKTLGRNSDFRHLTWNVGKGKKNGLHRIEIEEGCRVVIGCNKNEIERRTIKHNKEYLSKVKSTKAHDDKTCNTIIKK